MFHPLSRQRARVLSYGGVRTQGSCYPSRSPKLLQKLHSAASVVWRKVQPEEASSHSFFCPTSGPKTQRVFIDRHKLQRGEENPHI